VEYPPTSKRAGEEGDCLVKIHMQRDGTILDVTLLQKVGFGALDAECKNVFLLKIVKFPAVPKDVFPDNPDFTFTMPLSFKLEDGE
jgi:protein TonB